MTTQAAKATYEVTEIFTSLQGEGTRVGMLSTFVRLSRCNLSCNWCDTTYSWKAGEMVEPTVMSPEQILAEVHAPDVVLTGGEPMLQKLEPLLDLLEGRFVTVETNGTMFRPDPRVGLWSVSPKLGSSQQKPNKRVLREYVSQVPDKLQLKFVVGGREDLDAVKALLSELDGATALPIVLQPVGLPGESRDAYCERLSRLFEQEIQPDAFWSGYSLRVLPQFHKLLWGEKRGI
ncbi:7-carboxy-7-deazaguanine synthase [compost metagenome]